MTEKFQNKYRIASARLPNWDYGSNAPYFITVCTHNRECCFGNINHGNMQLSDIGHIAQKYWLEIPAHFPFVKLDAFVVMPNHVHGIVVIGKTVGDVVVDDDDDDVETPESGVSTGTSVSGTTIPHAIPSPRTAAASQKWQPATLGVIVNQYKRAVTINARKINAGFAWQSRYHDHIIRNDESYQRIRDYIIHNPEKWNTDKFNDLQ